MNYTENQSVCLSHPILNYCQKQTYGHNFVSWIYENYLSWFEQNYADQGTVVPKSLRVDGRRWEEDDRGWVWGWELGAA